MYFIYIVSGLELYKEERQPINVLNTATTTTISKEWGQKVADNWVTVCELSLSYSRFR